MPINYTYVSTNEVGISKIVSKCLWRKTAVRVRFFRLFKATVPLEAVYNKSRVFCWKVLTLMKNLKKCLGSENVKKNIFLCLSISHCNILTHWRLDIPKIGWVKEASVITENLRVNDSIKHLLRSPSSPNYITWALLCKMCAPYFIAFKILLHLLLCNAYWKIAYEAFAFNNCNRDLEYWEPSIMPGMSYVFSGSYENPSAHFQYSCFTDE